MTRVYRVFGTFMLMMMVSATALCGAESGNLRAGAAKADITPPESFFPYPPGRTTGTCVGVHDRLHARAIVLDNGSSRVAVVALDLIGVPKSQALSKRVADELGIASEHVMLVATHNHNSAIPFREGQTDPPQLVAYYEIIEKGVLEAARQAKANLQPARMGFGTGKAYINVNRDEQLGERTTLGFNPEGPSDKTVAVVKFETPSGEPIAVFMNYAVHAVVMLSSRTKDGVNGEISGDLPGATSRYVEEYYKDKAVAVWTSGAAGDQNPIYMANYNNGRRGYPRLDTGAAGYALLEVQSRRLGEEVVRVANAIQAATSEARIWGAHKIVTCPGQRISQDGSSWQFKTVEGPPVDIRLSLLMIDDVALGGVNGEAVSIVGQHFKQASPFAKTMMVTHVGGSIGNIPDDASYPRRTFEVLHTPLKEGYAENAIIKGLVGLMQDYMAATRP
jgi:neutral ceramidase